MNYLCKLTFLSGLGDVVMVELRDINALSILSQHRDHILINLRGTPDRLLSLRSITNVYIIQQGEQLHPRYLARHKSVIGSLIEQVFAHSTETFRTFKLSCAGPDTPEVASIEKYITEHYKLTQSNEADLELYIGKTGGLWETGVRLGTRPLSLRPYRVANVPGGMNPTIAHALNSLCDIFHKQSYLNICSGSGTLLIEAGLTNPSLQLTGIDINAKTNTLAIQNIKQAGLISRIKLTTADLLEKPNLGTFDVITADLPFGMQISKGEDLTTLYKGFLDYCTFSLNPNGIVGIYTAEFELLEKLLLQSPFITSTTRTVIVPTTTGAYMKTKIIVCKSENILIT